MSSFSIFPDSSPTRRTRVTRSVTDSSLPATAKVARSFGLANNNNGAHTNKPRRALLNNEKENINPLTGTTKEKGKSSKASTKPGKQLANNARPNPPMRSLSSPNYPPTSRPASGSRRGREGTSSILPTVVESSSLAGAVKGLLLKSAPIESEQDTVSGRLLHLSRFETDEDRLARELTVRPLADLSVAFNASTSQGIDSDGDSVVVTPIEATVQESVPVKFTEELDAALNVLKTSDEVSRLPYVVQRRNLKRGFEDADLYVDNRDSVLPAVLSSTESSPQRPLKRLRSVPNPPPNSPARRSPRSSTSSRRVNVPSVGSSSYDDELATFTRSLVATSSYVSLESTFSSQDYVYGSHFI